MPYVFSLVAMKVTVMMLLASNQRGMQERSSYSDDPSAAAVAVVGALIATEEELNNRHYWQMLDNIEKTEVEATGANRTHGSSIWLIYNRVPRSAGLTIVYLIQELAKINRFAHQRHQYRTPWNRFVTVAHHRSWKLKHFVTGY